MHRLIPVLIGLALVLAACGVERNSDDTLGADAEASQTDTGATDGDDASDSADGDDVAPPTTLAPAPTTTAPPGDVAVTATFDDTVIEITHGEMNELAGGVADSQEFLDLALGGTMPPTFVLNILNEQLISATIDLEIGEAGREVTDDEIETSRVRLLQQVEGLFPTATEPAAEAERLYDEIGYLQFLTRYQAGQDVLTAVVADEAEPGAGNPCVRHILVDTEAEAQAALDRLADGEDFSELAMELSTGPSGPNGGDLGCVPSSNYVPPFAEAVDAAEVGEVAGPVETEFGFHVFIVDSFEVDGRNEAAERLRTRLGEATVEVDERLGAWDPVGLSIVPAG